MIDYDDRLYVLIDQALKEDIGNGDHTTLSCIPENAKGKALLKIKQPGVLAGVEIAEKIFRYVSPSITFSRFKRDGEEIHLGEIAFQVIAPVHTILKCERVVLNCMQRMSGISTLTHTYNEKIKSYKTRLLDTRKTTPNFRLLEKEAVRIGGGVNHRFGLFDMIMLKDNHIDYCGGIINAIEKAYEYTVLYKPDLKIEVETRTIEDVKKVVQHAKGKEFRIMLDNFTPSQINDALKIIDNNFETEASGGMNLENIQQYAETGVDYISAGAIIHQAKSLDLSLKALID